MKNLSLSHFYGSGQLLTQLLLASREKLKDLNDPFDSVIIGAPFVLNDDIACKLIEEFYTLNTHYVPNRRPCIGLSTGSFLEHKGSMYLTANLVVMSGNMALFHNSRLYDEKLTQWETVAKSMVAEAERIELWMTENHPALQVEIQTSFKDDCGFNLLETPSKEYLDYLRTIVENIQETEMIDACNELINKCEPFTGIGVEMNNTRRLTEHKGILSNHGTYFGVSSPTASGGAAWFQLVGSEVKHCIPGDTNLLFFASAAGKNKGNSVTIIGIESSPVQPMMFVIPEQPLLEIAKIVDASKELTEKWPSFAPISNQNSSQVHEQAFNWSKETLEYLWSNNKVKEILLNATHSSILGVQIDMTDDKTAVIRPVISNTCFETCKEEIDPSYVEGAQINTLQDIVNDIGEGYTKISKGFFANVKEAQA